MRNAVDAVLPRLADAGLVPHGWQREALDSLCDFVESGSHSFSVQAVVGAGKTYFGVMAAHTLFNLGVADFIVTISPSRLIRDGWVEDFSRSGLNVVNVVNGDTFRQIALAGVGTKTDGFSITSGMAADLAPVLEQLVMEHRVLFILDEAHHYGVHENLSWGSALDSALKQSAFVIPLSGTMYRMDSAEIAGARYAETEAGHALDIDFSFDYEAALIREVETGEKTVRVLSFNAMYGEVMTHSRQWGQGYLVHTGVDIASASHGSFVRGALLDFEGGMVKDMIAAAHAKLLDIRRQTGNNYGGLVLAKNQEDARKMVKWIESTMRDEHGRPVEALLSTSDDDQQGEAFREFQQGGGLWLVSVKKVSEGANAPRIIVEVYASREGTQLAITQAFGRAVRYWRDKPLDEQSMAHIFVPAMSPWMDEVARIEQITAHLPDELKPPKRKPEKSTRTCPVCSTEVDRGASVCPGCGYEWPVNDVSEFTDGKADLTAQRHAGDVRFYSRAQLEWGRSTIAMLVKTGIVSPALAAMLHCDSLYVELALKLAEHDVCGACGIEPFPEE